MYVVKSTVVIQSSHDSTLYTRLDSAFFLSSRVRLDALTNLESKSARANATPSLSQEILGAGEPDEAQSRVTSAPSTARVLVGRERKVGAERTGPEPAGEIIHLTEHF